MSQINNPFIAVGVGKDATAEEINAAWRTAAKRLHPDRHPNSNRDELERLTTQMSILNASYQLLRDDLEGMRQTFYPDTSVNAGAQRPGESAAQFRSAPVHPSPETACQACGSMNAIDVGFVGQVGMLITRQVSNVEARLCKYCAQSIGRRYQSLTMVQGWWGAIAFLSNIFYIFLNALALNKVSRLPNPVAPLGFVTSPSDPGRAVMKRPMSWVAPVLLVAVLAIAASTGPAPSQTFSVGECVAEDQGSVTPVSCSTPHLGFITEATSNYQACPATTDTAVTTRGVTYCIDFDQ